MTYHGPRSVPDSGYNPYPQGPVRSSGLVPKYNSYPKGRGKHSESCTDCDRKRALQRARERSWYV